MPNELAHFWIERYKQAGHTGWKDPVIYAYDQIERLAIVSTKLATLPIEPLTTLDFGCGTGDFSRLLLKRGFRVCGYDPYVRPQISHPDFTYMAERAELEALENRFDLILSVTVLDHILDDQEFQMELTFLRTRVCETGSLLVLEYASEKPIGPSNNYQAFRTIDQWQEYLGISGWLISNIEPVPRPSTSPSEGFNHYRESLATRTLGKPSRIRLLRPLLLPLLRKQAQRYFDRYGIGQVNQSALKLIACTPNAAFR